MWDRASTAGFRARSRDRRTRGGRSGFPAAGPHGFDKQLFVQQVAGLSQLAGELMLVKPIVIDLGWGNLKSALIKLPDAEFVAPQNAATQRQTLVNQYVAAFRSVEVAAHDDAR